MKRNFIFISLLFLCTEFIGVSQVSLHTCYELAERMNEIVELPEGLMSERELSRVKDSTVEIVGSIEGIHGGKLLKVRKIGATWGSSKTTVVFDPQGDPRSFMVMLGESRALFFGFRQISGTEMFVPDVAEFNGAIAKLNRFYQGKFGNQFTEISYYRQVSSKLTDYLNAWVRNYELPVAKKSNHFFHDMSFHSSAIFLPHEVLEHGRRRVAYVEKFIQFLKDNINKQNPKEVEDLNDFIKNTRKEEATRIDFYTGALADGIINYLNLTKGTLKPGQSTGRLIEIFKQAVLGRAYSAEVGLLTSNFYFSSKHFQSPYQSTIRDWHDIVIDFKKSLTPNELMELIAPVHSLSSINLAEKIDYFKKRKGIEPTENEISRILVEEAKLAVNDNNPVLSDLCRKVTLNRQRAIESVEILQTQ